MSTTLKRSAGVLLHLTSLPGPYGIGDMGREATTFLDFLEETGMSWWQMLPLNPPGYGFSPYQPWSAFAGNPLLISPDMMIEDGLLRASDLVSLPRIESTDRVSEENVPSLKWEILRKSFERFTPDNSYVQFCEQERDWLEDAVLYKGLSDYYDGRPWTDWEAGVAGRDPEALRRAGAILREEIEFQRFVQYIFFKQHDRLKREANGRGIGLIGDIPIFVAHDSADVWAHQHLFALDSKGMPTVIAGVPPDYFSKTGQRWGNPLYRWEVMQENGYRWWTERLRMNLRLYDLVRIDHFRGFEAYWEIPAGEKTAVNGKWVKGPGADFFFTALGELHGQLHQPRILAEDLGDISPEVEMLRDQFSFPGMKVLQFGVGDPSSIHLPHNFHSPHTVVYTGTHDNNTTLGWWKELDKKGKAFLREYSGKPTLGRTKRRDVVQEMIRLAFSSTASLAIIPLQDLLGLDTNARMNVPGAESGENWLWRLKEGGLQEVDREELGGMLELYSRGRKG